jgi:hypothetical protein
MRDGERRAAQITFRTTRTLKGLAERLARAEGRSLANMLEQLIWNECRERGERAQPGDKESGRGRKPLSKPTLSDLGINKTQSSRWQKLAALDSDVFENKVETASKRAYDLMAYRLVKADEIERAKQQHGKLIEHGCTVADLVALADSGKRFGVIYPDPAWPWETWSPGGKIKTAPDNHYGTSTLDEIAKLPVARLAADNCALFLWCTAPHITKGNHIPIIEAWGFKPSTFGFVWIKENPSGEGLHMGQG